MKEVYDRRAALDLDAEQMRLLEKTYKAFVRAGALLDGEQKARLKEINEELSLAAVKFGNNIRTETNNYVLMLTNEELDGLPAGVREQAREKAAQLGKKDRYAFTLHKPSLIPFLTYSSKRELREEIYKAYLNRCNNGDEFDNKQLINDFIRLRTEKAHLLGYPSYAAYVVDDEMAGTTEAVYGLLDEVWTPALERAKGELAEMEELFRKDVPDGEFASWDWWYYAEKLRKQKYALDEEMLRPYFSLENVQTGIFFLANRLYGITFRPVVVPLYHPEALAFEGLDADESHLGILYFDYFPRDGKSQGAWCGNYVEQTYEDGKRVAPVVSVVCNFTRPTSNAPALLTLDEAETLFHEFGHALHFLFHDVRYRGLTEVEGDFVELPSQLMENWAFDPEMLKQYAVNYRSDEVIPHPLHDRIRAVRSRGLRARGADRKARPHPADRAPLSLSLFLAHFRWRLFGRILFLYVGRGAGQGCLRGVPRERRPVQQAHRRRFPPQGAGPWRFGRRHDPLPRLPRQGSRQAPDAPCPRALERSRSRRYVGCHACTRRSDSRRECPGEVTPPDERRNRTNSQARL